MGILDFERPSPSRNQTAAQDRPQAKIWLNVGYEANGRFVNLPIGIPVDTMEPAQVRGQNEEWVAFQTARNELLKAIQSKGDELEPGAELDVNLKVRIRKINGAMEIATEDNEFSTDLTQLFG